MNFGIQLGIRAWLLLLTQIVAIPLATFSFLSLYKFWEMQEQLIVSTLLQRTEAVSNTIEMQLKSLSETATAITLGPAAQNDDLPALYEYMRRVQATLPDVASMALIAPDGQQVLNILRPFGAVLPRTGNPAMVKLVFDTARAAVSGPFVGGVSKRTITIIGVPVMIDGAVRYCLTMAIHPQVFNGLLGGERLPKEWTAVIVDKAGAVVAHTQSVEDGVGRPAPPSILAAIRDGSRGPFRTVTQDRLPARTAISSVPLGGWTVAVSVPEEVIEAPLRHSFIIFSIGGVLLSLAGIGSAIWLSRRLSEDVARTADGSARIVEGDVAPMPPNLIRELTALEETLGTVCERAQQRSADLFQARHDSLTGLPSRALFSELAEALRAACLVQKGNSIAILFIDLDGFKQLNDVFGHEAGDQCLVESANNIRSVLRDADVSGRLGGDEFIVCVTAPEAEIESTATSVARRILDRIGQMGFGVGCSIGISFLPVDCDDPSCEMKLSCAMKRADEAMYDAKRLGKNRYVVHARSTRHCGAGRRPLATATDYRL